MLEWIAELLVEFEPRDILLTGGLVVGLLFGALAQKSSFCFRRAILDGLSRKFGSHAVMYGAALAMAILGSQWLFGTAEIEAEGIVYLTSNYSIGAIIVGGLLFGVGMVLTNGCTARHLVLASEGSARSWVVLSVLAITAYATLRGILALPRLEIEAAGQSDTLGVDGGILTLTELISNDVTTVGMSIGAIILLVVAIVAIRKASFKSFGFGIAIGLLIPMAWAVTGVFGYDEFEPAAAQSLSYVSPLANSLQFLMTYTGSSAGFGTTMIAGSFIGAFTLAALTGKFSFRSFEKDTDILRYVAGAALMGFGGVTALGCTVGQGLAGVSLLSISSLFAIGSIAVGGLATGYVLKRREKSKEAEVSSSIGLAV